MNILDKLKVKEVINKLTDRRYSHIMNLVIILLVNIVGITLYFRIDLTKDDSYSLSDISKEVVSSLQDPLNIKVFFTSDLPAPYNSVQRYLSDLLEEYDQYGNRHFSFEFVDVEKDKQMASNFGIRQAQVREIKDDQVKFRNAYMGLAIVHGDLIEKIDSITDTEGIEYRITSLIKKMNDKIDSLMKIEDKIQVTLYVSTNLPEVIHGLKDLDSKVKEEVTKCSEKNYNKLSFQFKQIESEKAAGDISSMYGIMPIKWPNFSSPSGKFYKEGSGVIGILVEHGKKFEAIQILSKNIFGQILVNTKNLEERIKTAVDNLISISPKIGYVTGHKEKDIKDAKEGAANLKQLISDMYELKEIDLTSDDIPGDIDVIIINGPQDKLSDHELFMIDQFLMKGKSALFLVDSFMEISAQGGNMFNQQPMALPLNTGLEQLISYYGVTVNKDIVLDEDCYKTSNKVFGEQKIYFAPMIGDNGLDSDSVITRYLKRIFFLKASSLDIKEEVLKKSGVEYASLVSSSGKSWLMKGRINYNPMMMRPPGPDNMKSYKLAVLLNGEMESYFKDKDVPVKEGDKTTGKSGSGITSVNKLKKSVKPSRIIVIGTSEITSANVIDKDGKSPNAVFMHNVIDFLSGNVNVPEMRAKGLKFNPLEDSSEATKVFLKVLNIGGLPLLVILAGIFVWRFRNILRNRIMAEFSGEVKDE